MRIQKGRNEIALFRSLSLLLFVPAARAGSDVIYGNVIVAFYGSDCSNPVAIIPVGSPYVNCESIPGAGESVQSIRAAGIDVCVRTGWTYAETICASYNSK